MFIYYKEGLPAAAGGLQKLRERVAGCMHRKMEPYNEFLVKDYFLRLLYDTLGRVGDAAVESAADLEALRAGPVEAFPWVRGRGMFWMFSQFQNHYYSLLVDKAGLPATFAVESYNRVKVYRFTQKYPGCFRDLFLLEGYCTMPFHFHAHTVHLGRLPRDLRFPALSLLEPVPSVLAFVDDVPSHCCGLLLRVGGREPRQFHYALRPGDRAGWTSPEVLLLATAHADLPDVYYLQCRQADALQDLPTFAYVDSLERSLRLQRLFEHTKQHVVRCTYHPRFERWTILEPVDRPREPASLTPASELEKIVNSTF